MSARMSWLPEQISFAVVGILALTACAAAGPSDNRAQPTYVAGPSSATGGSTTLTSERGSDGAGGSTRRSASAADHSVASTGRSTGSGIATAKTPTSTSTATSASAPARSLASTAEAWVVPGPGPRSDGTLWMRWSNRTAAVGSGTGFVQVAQDTDSTELAVAGFFAESGSTILARESAGPASVGQLSTAVNPVVLADSGTVYVQQAKALLLEEPQANGPAAKAAVRRSVPLPSLATAQPSGAPPPTVPPPTVPPSRALQKGFRNTQTTVGALARTPSGTVAAFVSNGSTAAVMDAGSGKIAQLPGYGAFGPAALGDDGLIRVLGWQPAAPESTLRVLTVDPATWTIASAFDTHVGQQQFLQASAVRSGGSVALFVFHGTPAAVHASGFVLRGSKWSALELPDGIGLAAAPGDGTTALLYGGPARNAVSVVDMVSGVVTRDIPAWRSPAGSYVVAVAAIGH